MTKVALVTGGTRGIGAAISIALKNDGCKVAATYGSNSDAANAFASANGIEVFQWNVADAAACESGVKQVEEKLGSIDISFTNALPNVPVPPVIKIDLLFNICFIKFSLFNFINFITKCQR